jgi:hypothetical protein
MFSVQHVNQSAAGGSGAEDQPALSVQAAGALAAGAFPSEGVRGAKDLVIWRANNAAVLPSSMLEVYRIEPDQPPQRLTYTELSDTAGPAVDPTVLSGDVDSSSPGNEIVVVGGDGAGRSARVCVFGGMVDEQVHLLSDFYMPRRAMGDEPSVPAIGHVVPDSWHTGVEIIIGGKRGRVYAVGLDHGHPELLSVLRAFRDRPKATARKLAVGDVIPDIPGDEIVVADDGTVGDALVRVFDSQTQRVVAEFEAFAPGAAPAGVELWVGDVLTTFPGAELLVGEGPAGGRVSVFTVASGVPTHVLDVPDPLNRATSLLGHLAIGNLLPDVDGDEIAVAQGDPRIPVQVFNLNTGLNGPAASVQAPDDMDTVTAVATTY